MKEVMQEIILYGLSQSNFFEEAAFYGNTALRIFYGLDRFSEDLDFSLLISNTDTDGALISLIGIICKDFKCLA